MNLTEWDDAGIGLFFSAFMIGLTAVQARYTPFSPRSSEEFSSASRSVKPGLIAAGIVSAWTWAATLVCPLFLPICCLQADTDLL
jgi:Na+/proline symporter